MTSWRIGEAVACVHPWGHHVGIVVGSDAATGEPLVAHCSRRVGFAAIETMSAFAQGRPVRPRRLVSPLAPAEITRRALGLLGRRYRLLSFNCEHFVGAAMGLTPRSPQVRTYGLAAGALALVALDAARRLRRPSRDP